MQTSAPIELLPAEGILALSSKPTGANVTLDGEFQGQTPVSLQLTPDSPSSAGRVQTGLQALQ